MISKIRIQNFKSLEDVTLECSNLNVLTGLNGMGKSSVIQALLLLRQSSENGTLENKGLSLAGDLINIGTSKDAFYEFAEKEELHFHLDLDSSESLVWSFAYTSNSEVAEGTNSKSNIIPYIEGAEIPKKLTDVNLFEKGVFRYLNADRLVKDEYPISPIEMKNRGLGKHGEFASDYLLNFGSKEIKKELFYPGTTTYDLNYQVSSWMSEISPGIKISASEIPGINSVKLRYKFTGNKVQTSEYTPTNVGFGITYILSVLVALLSSEPGDILLIENPESHLHPQGQSSIGRLIGLASQLGVQIFVETHSDHIINGICLAVNKKQLDSKNVRLNYLFKNNSENITTNFPVEINQYGKIDDSKLKEIGIGFFDQIQKDLSIILFENR